MSQHASDRPAPRVLLTGRPGCGKTTVIRRTVERIGLDRCAGFYTEEVREGGRRIGFDVVTLEGERGPLARTGASGPQVSRYGVDIQTFEELGVTALERALHRDDGLLVIDEIGKMELFSDRFVDLLDEIFRPDSSHPVLGSVLRAKHPVAAELRSRPGISLVEVTSSRRDWLPERLASSFREILSGAQESGP